MALKGFSLPGKADCKSHYYFKTCTFLFVFNQVLEEPEESDHSLGYITNFAWSVSTSALALITVGFIKRQGHH